MADHLIVVDSVTGKVTKRVPIESLPHRTYKKADGTDYVDGDTLAGGGVTPKRLDGTTDLAATDKVLTDGDIPIIDNGDGTFCLNTGCMYVDIPGITGGAAADAAPFDPTGKQAVASPFRVNAGTLEYHNGTVWVPVTTTSVGTAPAAPSLALTVNGDGTLNASGMTEALATVNVTFPSGDTKQVTADGAGNYTATSTNGVEPAGSAAATATNANGTSPVATTAFNPADTTAPNDPAGLTVTNSGDATNIACVSGTGEVGAKVLVTFPSGETNTTNIVNGAENFGPICSTTAQPDGDVDVQLEDAAGNQSGTVSEPHTAFVATPVAWPNVTTIGYSGADTTHTIPATANWVRFTLIGAAAGDASRSGTAGVTQGTFNLNNGPIAAGDTISVMVGQFGDNDIGNTYGFGGDGGTTSLMATWSGGGLTGIFTGTGAITDTDHARALLVAGGGGGGGSIAMGTNTEGTPGNSSDPETAGGNTGSMAGLPFPFAPPGIDTAFGGNGGGYEGGSRAGNAVPNSRYGIAGTGFAHTDAESVSIVSGVRGDNNPPALGSGHAAYNGTAGVASGVASGVFGDGHGLLIIEWD